jgi:predicted  nucleic acid-binding Zn-ribbon protein
LITIETHGAIHIHVHPAGADVSLIQKALAKLLTSQEHLMTKISETADAQRAAFARLETAYTGLSSDLQGLSSDVKSLNAKIAELQATSGEITAEDQTLLDEMQAISEAVVSKFEALDALTTDAKPPEDPVTS